MTKTLLLLSVLAALSAYPMAAADSTKDQLIQATKALAEQANYRWETKVEVPEGTRFRPGPSAGKLGRDGVILYSTSRGNSTTQVVIKGEKAAVTDRDGKWQSLAEAEQAPGFGRFTESMVRGIKNPAEEVLAIVAELEEIHNDGDVYIGKLSEEGAGKLAAAGGGFGRRGGRGGRGSNVLFAKATVKFWVKNGMLNKFEQYLDASLDFNGNELVVERTTTTTIEDVGTTEVEIPKGAKPKLQ